MRFYLIFSLILFTISCTQDSKGWIAQYGDDVLTKAEVNNALPPDLESKDSAAFVNLLIEQWAKDKVLLKNSKEILSKEELAKIDYKVARYKVDITTSFIEEKLTQNLNDSISVSEIESYYKNYKDSFGLKEDYLSYRYLVIPTDSVSAYKKLLRNNDYDKLKTKLEKYQYTYDFKTDNWISRQKFDQTNLFPKELQKFNLKTKNQIFTVKQFNNTFILELIEYRRINDTSPLPLVKDVIKNVLINKRKLNLLSEKKKELYHKAIQNDEIKRN